ncbi:hypothetical protein GS429_04440 [Natronorubrum sp. JWXQ-INN-674]|uniref:Uncharacterized protein n=1 Tax=Natronorubrum halalkaliphilum TaxID=2691917 RepID=A0A6B0VIH8_9EURY|nr:hypothetical protein [Natronorubrum halalkaliphilum]MXV61324.1 hypothetical protein [Natronorubrum halalkaliphilum]
MWTRRALFGAACTTALLAGCLGDDEDDAEEGANNGYDPHLDEIDDYDPVDRTGESKLTIQISPGREPAFDPDPVMIDSNTQVTWRWGDSTGEIEPVEVHSPCQWSGSDGGTSHSWTFPFEGKYVIGYSSPDVEGVTGTMFVIDPDD